MFWHFFSFEVRYWLRSVILWVFTGIIALLFFAAVSTDQISVGGAIGNTFHNAPYVIENFYSFVTVLTLLMMTAFVNAAASREFEFNTYQVLFTTPISKTAFLLGRYCGAVLVSVIPTLGVSVGILLGKYMPWADAERWGPVVWRAHLAGLMVFVVPNTILFAAIVFTIAVLTRSRTASFIGSLLVLVGTAVAGALTSDLRNEPIADLLDPTGSNAFNHMTKYWTVADRNTLVQGLTGDLLWNRLVWVGVGLAIFAFGAWRFSFAERSKRQSRRARAEAAAAIHAQPGPTAMPVVARSYGAGAQFTQFSGTVRVELKRLLKSTVFVVVALAALLNVIPALIFNAGEGYGVHSLPVTYQITALIRGTLYLFLVGIITFFAGVLVWEERDVHMDEIRDATPCADWPAYTAKLIALVTSVAILIGLAMCAGIATQVAHHYTRIQPGLYVETLFGIDLIQFVYFAVFAFFIHVLSPNKYVGYFGFIVLMIANAFAWQPLHVATNLVRLLSTPSMTYSDFFGYAPYLEGWIWFTVYWGLFCVLLSIAAVLLWPRGRELRLGRRVAAARNRLHGVAGLLTAMVLLAFVGTGAWIFVNTEIWNKTESTNDRDRATADYEKTYKRYEHQGFPRIVDVKYAIDLRPETRGMTMTGDEVLRNESAGALSEIHFTLDRNFDTEIQMAGLTPKVDDKRLSYRIYTLQQPMQPGEDRPLHFVVKTHTRGFENQLTQNGIAPNGSFFNNGIAPQIGYQDGGELTDPNTRKRFHLAPKELMPALERNCTADCRNNYISNNSDWVNVETTISTAPDQIAIAPGSLEREWTERGRRFFHYKLDHEALNFYSFLSASYVVRREKFNGIDVEVYYLKQHPWNVDRMVNSVEKSLAYYTTNFGPYYERQARIIEFPRVASFAQAFPGTMPFSEAIGFIANFEKPDSIDSVFYITAHEMAHQWWAHQVVGANMQGATSLSETQAQYSALMLMEHEYGRDQMRKFLGYEMDNYLRSRGAERLKERPLMRVEASQGYIHYRKGSIVMYSLKERIGEAAVNRALRSLVQQYAYKPAPYPTSWALIEALSAQTPPEAQSFLHDLFYDITLFSNRTLDAKAKKRADGQYDVTIQVEAHKFKADEKGAESEVPVDDLIEVGALAAPGKGLEYGKVLVRQTEHMHSGLATYTFVSPTLPDKAGIDPVLLLVDRVPSDNLKAVTVH